jgi:hypothetical protein
MRRMSKQEVDHLTSLPGVTVQKRRSFKVPKTRKPVVNKNPNQNHFRGKPIKDRPGRNIIFKGDKRLDQPENTGEK